MTTVLLSGITGFLGSHIAENLIENNIKVIGLKRKNSDIWRCSEFKNKIHWVDVDENGVYINQLKGMPFQTVIHGAWIGVESDERNDWYKQIKNIDFLVDILEVSKQVGASKFIFLGSQSEYGNIKGKIDESHSTEALNAYGGVKLGCLEILKTFSRLNEIEWIWLRLFSLYGEKQGENWLLPSLIKSIKENNHKDFTLGEQVYAYLYVKDFAMIINKIINMPIESGIYNISSNEGKTIKSLVESVRNYVNPNFILNFGALDYRKNQSMHIEGDITKISSQIGEIKFTDFNISLKKTIDYYM